MKNTAYVDCSAREFFIQPMGWCPRVAPPTVFQASAINQGDGPQAYPWAKLIGSFPCLRFPLPRWFYFVSSGQKNNQYSIQLLLKWIHSFPRNMEPILGTIMGAKNLRLDSHRPLVENQLLFLWKRDAALYRLPMTYCDNYSVSFKPH